MTYIIAEAGTSHAHPDPYRRVALATRHVCLAAEAGAQAVKFQLFVPDEPLFCPLAGDEKRWQRWQNTFLSLDEWRRLRELAFKMHVDLLLSAFQPTAVDWCRLLALRYYKVASRAVRDYPYDKVPGPFIMSNGMYDPFTRMTNLGMDPLAVVALECTSQYPVPLEQAKWSGKFDGLSDHSGTIYPGLDAIVRGAKFLEVHFTDGDKSNDPNISVEQLRTLCDANAGIARLGSGGDQRGGSAGKAVARRGVAAS